MSGYISFYDYEASNLKKNILQNIAESISNKNMNNPPKFCAQI